MAKRKSNRQARALFFAEPKKQSWLESHRKEFARRWIAHLTLRAKAQEKAL
ncbi:hypothetical protein [Serratia marcescens]|uniref:hypothetical protein n=1 Tax=Serratia marcescens TaxID=615 RepID=UPI00132FD256|nr:hypothetical protein [Serratia marcescens]